MNVKRTTIVAALLAVGIATTAIAQAPAPGSTTSTPKPAPSATTSTPAPPSAGSTGMDKGAGTGAASSTAAPATSKATGNAKLDRSDVRFAEKAMQGGMAEVEVGKLAMDKAQDAQVKSFAKRMVDDHTKANAELSKIASTKGISPPAAVDASHKRKMDRMSSKSGADFDRAYMDGMVDDHQATVRDFRNAARSAKDPDIKAFATSTLPTLEQHLQEAKTIDAAVKGRKAPAQQKAKS